MYMIMIFMFILSIIMMMISSMISKKSFNDREKSSPFECGFDPKDSPRLPFSLHFFLIAVIFLVFDIEIALIMPFIIAMKYSSMSMLTYISMFFFFILILGIYHEWNQGALSWTT
uniref:NADH-ubiquinone oxidoreductase chain 3 n=1 Tax=Scydosella musawasensis TaxID=1819563 RepID=A0A165CYN6_9COLE|nr:NADH dehydrogenase subunit 3 [Scydosella musawasensis]